MSGIPLNKVDHLRGLLEENGYSLSNSTHLRQLVPFILKEEITNIKEEISSKPISIIFDGTTHAAEAFVVVLRFVDDDGIGRLFLLAKSLTGEEVARLLVETVDRAWNSISSDCSGNARQGICEL